MMVGARVLIEDFETGPGDHFVGFPANSLYGNLSGPPHSGVVDSYGRTVQWNLNFSGGPASPPNYSVGGVGSEPHSGTWMGNFPGGRWYAYCHYYPADGIGLFFRRGFGNTPGIEVRADDQTDPVWISQYVITIVVGTTGLLTITEYWYDTRYDNENGEEGTREFTVQLPDAAGWFEVGMVRDYGSFATWYVKQNGATLISNRVPREMNKDGIQFTASAFTPGEFIGAPGAFQIDDVYGYQGVFRPDPELVGQMEDSRARIY